MAALYNKTNRVKKDLVLETSQQQTKFSDVDIHLFLFNGLDVPDTEMGGQMMVLFLWMTRL